MIKLDEPTELAIIKKIIDEATKPEIDRIMEAQMNGDFDYEPINPKRVNKEIYDKLIKEYKTKNIKHPKIYDDAVKDSSHPLHNEYLTFLKELPLHINLRKQLLESYVETLDKSRIKTPKEYYQEIEDAPIYIVSGTNSYTAPEGHASLTDRQAKLNFDHYEYDKLLKDNLTTMVSKRTGRPQKCSLEEENLSLDELISTAYAKYAYNQPELDNCRHFIVQRLSSGEQFQDPETETFLRLIDPALYDTYKNKAEIKKKYYTKKYSELMDPNYVPKKKVMPIEEENPEEKKEIDEEKYSNLKKEKGGQPLKTRRKNKKIRKSINKRNKRRSLKKKKKNKK